MFGDKTDLNRSNRNCIHHLEDPLGKCTPGDELSSERIKNFHLKMESRRLQYATRFSPGIRELIRSVENLQRQLDDVDDIPMTSVESECDSSYDPICELEKLFTSALAGPMVFRISVSSVVGNDCRIAFERSLAL